MYCDVAFLEWCANTGTGRYNIFEIINDIAHEIKMKLGRSSEKLKIYLFFVRNNDILAFLASLKRV